MVAGFQGNANVG